MTTEPEYVNGVRKDIYEEMVNMVKDFFDSDFTVTAGERRYIWDSEKKELIDISEKKEE